MFGNTISIYSTSRPSSSYGTTWTQSRTPAKAKAKNEAEVAVEDVHRTIAFLRALNLALMCIVLMGYGMCASLFSPFFPTEAAKRDISATTVGFIFGSFTLMMFIGSIVAGFIVKEVGLNFMIWSGTLLAGGSTVLFGLLDQAPIGDAYVVLCFAVRIIEGAGASLYNTAAFSIVAQLYPQSVSTVYALLETSNGVGRMIGPTVGGILFNAGGFSLPFYVTGAMLLALGFFSAVLLQFTMPSKKTKEIGKEAGNEDENSEGANLPWSHLYRTSVQIWILTIAMSSSSLIFGYPQPTLALYFEQLGLTDPATVGLIFLGGSVAYTILSVIVGKIADTFVNYVYIMMSSGAALFAIGFFFFGPIPPLQSVIPPSVGLTSTCYVLLCCGVSILINPSPAAIMAAARSAGFKECLDTSAMVATLYNAMWFLGSFAGTPVAGFLMDMVGFEWGSFIMSMVATCTVFLLLTNHFLSRFESYKAKEQYSYALLYSESEASLLIKKTPNRPTAEKII